MSSEKLILRLQVNIDKANSRRHDVIEGYIEVPVKLRNPHISVLYISAKSSSSSM